MLRGEQEKVLRMCLGDTFLAHVPIATEDGLLNPDFPVGISIIYGDTDSVRLVDDDAAEQITEMNKNIFELEVS
mgnify:CR=1 FL=1